MDLENTINYICTINFIVVCWYSSGVLMRLKDITTKEFDEFYSLLEQDFPYLERKTKESQLNDYVNCDNFHICYIYDGNKKIGYFKKDNILVNLLFLTLGVLIL